jgi:protein TonB
MFEQSITLEPHTGRKAGALAASIGAQILGVGVLLLVPLLYNEVLPLVRPVLPLTPPLTSGVTPAKPRQTASVSRSTSIRLNSARVFIYKPSSNAAVAISQPVISDEPLATSVYVPGVPAGFGPATSSTGLSEGIRVKPEPPATPKPAARPTRISLGAEAAVILKKVLPVYPDIARRTRTSGTVRLTGVIAKDGTVQELKVISGHPLLVQAALDAVRQWVYRPTLLSGEPVEVVCPIDVIFRLSQ